MRLSICRSEHGWLRVPEQRAHPPRGRSVVDSHVLQDFRGRLNRLVANHVHADSVSAIFARHKGAARNVSGRGVHTLRLRFISEL